MPPQPSLLTRPTLFFGGLLLVLLTLTLLSRSSSYTREDGTEQPAARALAKGVWRHWTSGTGLGEGVEEFGELGEGETVRQVPRCGVDRAIVDEYGRQAVRLSRVHEGSGFRLQKVLEKAARGERIRVGVLGGSVSTGHGAIPGLGPHQYGAIPYESQWHQVVLGYLNSKFPGGTTFSNGAKAAVDSTFFEWCWSSLIGTELDLIFVEMAVNDEYDELALHASENLLRSLLSLPSAPAVIYVDAFALRTKSGRGGMMNGGDAHNALASFYDVPQISIRGPLLPALLRNHTLAAPWFLGDARHISLPLHAFLGRMVVAFLQDEQCRSSELVDDALMASDSLWPSSEILGLIPKLKITDNWNDRDKHYPVSPPMCLVAGAESLALQPLSGAPQWSLISWKDSKFYLEAHEANVEVVFEIDVPKGGLGVVAIGYLRSAQYNLGKARCRVGKQEVTIDGNWTRGVSLAKTAIVARGLAPGERVEVRCKVLPSSKPAKTFRIMSLMSL